MLRVDKAKQPIRIKLGTKKVYFSENDEENEIRNENYS